MAYTFVTLRAPRDEVRLQRLLERCSDYYELHEGWATPLDAGEYELKTDPNVAGGAELTAFALQERNDGPLDAMAQVLRDVPERGTWWIGLLVVAPELRGRAIGSELLRHVVAAAVAEDISTLKLAVSQRNARGLRFWQREGFVETGVTCSITARSGHAETGRIMIRKIGGIEA
jgi:GNAT superfamily N-acetyltransferase